ncbi:MAG: phage tail domain-containing protein [Cetobacterium sp.]
MNFLSENFWFDGISNKNMSVDLITFDSNIFNDMGIIYSKSLSVDNSVSKNPYYTENNDDTEDIVLNMLLVDEFGMPKSWDNYSLSEVTDWLLTDNFKPFISEDNEELTYYFKTTKITKHFTNDDKGYLEVTFKPYDNNCYLKVKYKGNKINIDNPSNHDDYYYPLIKVNSNSTISNLTTNEEPFTIETDMPAIVDCDMLTAITDEGLNIISKCNRKWLRLAKGKNVIQSDTEIVIECNFPIMR